LYMVIKSSGGRRVAVNLQRWFKYVPKEPETSTTAVVEV
jgi:hypothetical protein